MTRKELSKLVTDRLTDLFNSTSHTSLFISLEKNSTSKAVLTLSTGETVNFSTLSELEKFLKSEV